MALPIEDRTCQKRVSQAPNRHQPLRSLNPRFEASPIRCSILSLVQAGDYSDPSCILWSCSKLDVANHRRLANHSVSSKPMTIECILGVLYGPSHAHSPLYVSAREPSSSNHAHLLKTLSGRLNEGVFCLEECSARSRANDVGAGLPVRSSSLTHSMRFR